MLNFEKETVAKGGVSNKKGAEEKPIKDPEEKNINKIKHLFN